MKTLNFELSKKLNDLGLLDNIETEWKVQLLPTKEGNKWNKGRLVKKWNGKGKIYKTLTLEEAIEFIKIIKIEIANGEIFYDTLIIENSKYTPINPFTYYVVKYKEHDYISFKGYKILDVIEKMIEYLLDNDLIY